MPRAYSMERRAQLTAETRSRVLEAVLDLIAERGTDAVTVHSVAAQAGVARATVFYHFASRQVLLDAAWTTFAEQWATEERLALLEPTLEQRLYRFLLACYEANERHRKRLAALLRTTGYPSLTQEIERVRARRRETIQLLLGPPAEAGELRVPLADAAAMAYALSTHAMWEAFREQLRLPLAAAVQHAYHLLASTILPRPGEASPARVPLETLGAADEDARPLANGRPLLARS